MHNLIFQQEQCLQFLGAGQELVYNLLSLMPTQYQKDNLEAMLGLFLEAQGHPLPQYSQTKSASALSRFLNQYRWSTRDVIRTVRHCVLQQVLSFCPKGRRPCLQVIIDVVMVLTSTGLTQLSHAIAQGALAEPIASQT